MNELSPGHILLVDDDVFVRQSIGMAIAAYNLRVTEAGSAADSLELLKEYVFDCAVIDVGMPEIDGIELCRRIRAMSEIKPFPILILSGYADTKTSEEALKAGANDFLTKPFSIQTILLLLEKYKVLKK
jgi:two-component system response regulator PhoP